MITSKINSLLKKAFDTTLSDAVKSFVLKSRLSDGESFLSFQSRGVFESFTAEEIARSQGAITASDEQVILLQNELSTIPKIADIIIVAPFEYRVMGVTPDPTDSIWELQVRG